MKRVYQLSKALEEDSKRVALTQALTLDAARPMMGLKGTHGLFGSAQWWESIHQRRMPLKFVSGVILRTYFEVQHTPAQPNTAELRLRDGSVVDVGIYINDDEDVSLFKPGRRVRVVYALDELKKQPAAEGGVNYVTTALEMAVSLAEEASRPGFMERWFSKLFAYRRRTPSSPLR